MIYLRSSYNNNQLDTTLTFVAIRHTDNLYMVQKIRARHILMVLQKNKCVMSHMSININFSLMCTHKNIIRTSTTWLREEKVDEMTSDGDGGSHQ